MIQVIDKEGSFLLTTELMQTPIPMGLIEPLWSSLDTPLCVRVTLSNMNESGLLSLSL